MDALMLPAAIFLIDTNVIEILQILIEWFGLLDFSMVGKKQKV